MAYVNFKPVCSNCGYVFNNFTYTPPQQEEFMGAERELFIGLRRCDNCFLPRCCPNCGELITDFTIPVFTRDGEIMYKEEE